MSAYRGRFRRTDFGMTMKGGFALRNATDLTIIVGTTPTTPGTRAVMTGTIKTVVKLK